MRVNPTQAQVGAELLGLAAADTLCRGPLDSLVTKRQDVHPPAGARLFSQVEAPRGGRSCLGYLPPHEPPLARGRRLGRSHLLRPLRKRTRRGTGAYARDGVLPMQTAAGAYARNEVLPGQFGAVLGRRSRAESLRLRASEKLGLVISIQ